MSVEYDPEADLILYPADIREGLLRDQKQLAVRARMRRYANACFLTSIACGIAGGPLALKLGFLGTAFLFTRVAMRLYSSQRKMLTLHGRVAKAVEIPWRLAPSM